MMSSIFTRIVNREIPASILYEDDLCIAILDIHPSQKGHTLVIPKQELPWMDEYEDDIVAHCFAIAKQMMKHQKNVLPSVTHVTILVEGVQVPHRHIHVIPSYPHTITCQLPQDSYADGEQEHYTQLLTMNLSD